MKSAQMLTRQMLLPLLRRQRSWPHKDVMYVWRKKPMRKDCVGFFKIKN